jgi:hypothetical protein
MRHAFPTSLVLAGALAIVIAALLLFSVPVAAQTGESQAATKVAPTRLPDGRPDLQGIWGFATVTPLQRPKEFADKAVLTAEEKANLEEKAVREEFVDRPPPSGNRALTTGSGTMQERKWWRPTAPR